VGKVVARVVSPSPDGRSFVTCGLEREDWLFDVASATGRLFSSEEGCTRQAFSFSPDSKLFVSAGLGGELRIHDRWATRLLHGHDLAVTDAVFSPDGRLLASVSSDGTARLWALARGIVWAEGRVQPLSRVTPDGKMLLMNSDGSVELVDVRSGDRTSLQSARHGLPPGSVWPWRGSLSVDGRVAALRDTEGLLVVWDLIERTHRTVGRYDEPGTRVSADELSPDGSLLAQIDDRGTIRVVETATGSARRIGQLEDQGFGIAWSGDGRLLAAGGRDGRARVWDVATGTVRASLRSGGMILDIALSRDGKRFVAAGTDGIVSVVDIGTGAVRRLVGHVGAVSSADFLPDGDRLLSLGSDGTVRLWHLGHDEKGMVVRREGKPLGWLRVSADGSLVTSVSTDETTVWSTSSLPPSPHEALGDLPAFRRSVGAWTTAEVDGDTGALRSP
jgi:WD40 repeat protein